MKSKASVLLLLLISIMQFSCSKSDSAKTYIRIINGSPDAGALNLSFNGTLSIGNVSGNTASNYITTNAGNMAFAVYQASGSTPFVNNSLNALADTYYSVIIADSLSRVKTSVVVDSRTPPPAGKAYVKFIHLVPNGPAYDFITGTTTLSGARTFNDQISSASSAYVAVSAADLEIDVKISGTNTLVSSIPSVVFAEGKFYTILITGVVGGSGSNAIGMKVFNDKSN